MVFIESSFTLSLSVHVISCSCTYTYAAFASVKKNTWGSFVFFFKSTFFSQCQSNACLCLHKVIQSSWLSPSNSFLWRDFITIVRIVSLFWDDQRSCQATKLLWKQFTVKRQILSVESRFKVNPRTCLMEISLKKKKIQYLKVKL